jgi:L-cysteine:1D-myo-inositol 2-amino-2-deoxy-alpha-D-glucopyranoside ligase
MASPDAMRSWPAPEVPTSVRDHYGDAPAVAVHDSRSDEIRFTQPGELARLYVCGITPYDATHLGHAFTYLAFDLLIRAWREAGVPVRYVQNVTDVDDPLLERAAQNRVDWFDLAAEQTELFRVDMASLSVIPPDVFAGAVESMSLITELIGLLEKRGAAYRVDDDLYFEVAADDRFGELSRITVEEMRALFAERGGDPERVGKRDPLDCLLWRDQRPGEPGWDSPLGIGRPGWHVECAAIAREYLGTDFDVQGGGTDLVFPHHEMSASHARAVDPEHDFAQAYVHAGMVGYEGEKMSKSRGNLVLVSQLRARGVDPRVVRLALLSHHYREDWEWSDDHLDEAAARLSAWQTAVVAGGRDPDDTVAQVRAAMADDLDTGSALAAVDEWAAAASGRGDSGRAAGDLVADAVAASLGVTLAGR